MGSIDTLTAALGRATKDAAAALLLSARQVDSVLTAGSLENARASVDEATRKRAIRDALEEAWDDRDLGRTA